MLGPPVQDPLRQHRAHARQRVKGGQVSGVQVHRHAGPTASCPTTSAADPARAGSGHPCPGRRARPRRQRLPLPGHAHLLAVHHRSREVGLGRPAPGDAPPAAVTASSTRDPGGNRTTPARPTAPTTCTTTSVAVPGMPEAGAAVPVAPAAAGATGALPAAAAVPVPAPAPGEVAKAAGTDRDCRPLGGPCAAAGRTGSGVAEDRASASRIPSTPVTRTRTSSSPSTALRRGRSDAPRNDTGTVSSLGRGGAGRRCRPSRWSRRVDPGESQAPSRAPETWRRTRCRGGAVSSTSPRAGTHPSRSPLGGAPDTATPRRAARRSGGAGRCGGAAYGHAREHTGPGGRPATALWTAWRTPRPVWATGQVRRWRSHPRMLGSCRATMSSATASPHSRPSSTGSGSGPNSDHRASAPAAERERPGDPAGPPQDQPEQHHQPHREEGEDGEDRPE